MTTNLYTLLILCLLRILVYSSHHEEDEQEEEGEGEEAEEKNNGKTRNWRQPCQSSCLGEIKLFERPWGLSQRRTSWNYSESSFPGLGEMSLWIRSSVWQLCYTKTALRYDVPRDFDLLTIDTDYNDYWTKANLVGFTLRSSVAFSSWCLILLRSCNRWKDLACPADGWHLQTTCMFLTMFRQCLLVLKVFLEKLGGRGGLQSRLALAWSQSCEAPMVQCLMEVACGPCACAQPPNLSRTSVSRYSAMAEWDGTVYTVGMVSLYARKLSTELTACNLACVHCVGSLLAYALVARAHGYSFAYALDSCGQSSKTCFPCVVAWLWSDSENRFPSLVVVQDLFRVNESRVFRCKIMQHRSIFGVQEMGSHAFFIRSDLLHEEATFHDGVCSYCIVVSISISISITSALVSCTCHTISAFCMPTMPAPICCFRVRILTSLCRDPSFEGLVGFVLRLGSQALCEEELPSAGHDLEEFQLMVACCVF